MIGLLIVGCSSNSNPQGNQQSDDANFETQEEKSIIIEEKTKDICNCPSNKSCQSDGSCVSNYCKIITYKGNPEDKLDIIFVPDISYENMDNFLIDVQKHIDEEGINNGLFAFEPFKSNKNKINLYWLDKRFDVGELDSKLINIYYSPKTGEPDPIRSLCPEADQIIIINNAPSWGGTGRVFSGLTVSADNPLLTVHEFGHAFGDLMDEYIDPHPEVNETFQHGYARYFQKNNVNCFPAPSKEYCLEYAPWRDLVDGVEVSCYEGCGYFAKRIYRPTESSIMALRTVYSGVPAEVTLSFGPVNEKALLDELNKYG